DTDCRGDIRVAAGPADLSALLRTADGHTRARLVGDLQRRFGNAVVSRLLDPVDDPRPAIQRYAVNVPTGTTDCAVVVNWLNAHSPYIRDSGWAKTSVSFGWSGDYSYSGTAPDITVTISNPGVSLTKSVDMPTWSPTAASMRAAWNAMWADLRAHESRHEAIAVQWKASLLERLTNLSLTVGSRAAGPSAVTAEWRGWIREHQSDQSAIDPFTALLDCSAGTAETSDAGPAAGDEADVAVT
ncbi:MAG TPA: DUF922 domain-containing protein, partial [Candidatus Limnocylindrales bacterium]